MQITVLDHQRYPAAELAELYHRSGQAETAYFGLKVTLRGSDRVLRSHHTDDVRQELFGLLVVHQAARQIAVEAALQTGIDPSRISLAVTIRTARNTVITATGTTRRQGCQPTPVIQRAILHPRELASPHRRTRIQPRRVKRPISTFAYNTTRKNPLNPEREECPQHHHSHRSNTAMANLNFPVLGLGLARVEVRDPAHGKSQQVGDLAAGIPSDREREGADGGGLVHDHQDGAELRGQLVEDLLASRGEPVPVMGTVARRVRATDSSFAKSSTAAASAAAITGVVGSAVIAVAGVASRTRLSKSRTSVVVPERLMAMIRS